MKYCRKQLWFDIPNRLDVANFTQDVQKSIDESRVQLGLVLLPTKNIQAF